MTAFEQGLQHFFARWSDWILHAPYRLLLLLLLLTVGAVDYSWHHLNINTDTTELIAPEARFQKNRRSFEQAFPQDVNTLLLMVESDAPELTLNVTQRLSRQLRADHVHFESVYVPSSTEFFQKQGLLYLNLAELHDISHSLTQAQAFIGRLTADNSLNGLFSILTEALTHTDSK